MQSSALIVDNKDNVATALRQLEKGTSVGMQTGDSRVSVVLSQAIPFGHKFALRTIEKGEPVIKYGEVIGLATTKINKGEHVHVHNTEGLKGRGDKL